MIQLNENPINHNGYQLIFIATKYQYGDNIAIEAFCMKEGPYAHITINPISINAEIPLPFIVINPDLNADQEFIDLLIENLVEGPVQHITYAFTQFLVCKLQDKILEQLNEGEYCEN